MLEQIRVEGGGGRRTSGWAGSDQNRRVGDDWRVVFPQWEWLTAPESVVPASVGEEWPGEANKWVAIGMGGRVSR
jgi:hypothetical protein